ncbi:hypothetical protein HOLleu_03726 [Holothuria leucospilota]|uniref:Uncharacterized protein n=1 Tax=Holothuria leucospilota TaxID=206669 RepID=A0A9Q1CSY2_HOLLE|nr:hypothetical protein HOLleu_03726 [Holothuria leucospilota]
MRIISTGLHQEKERQEGTPPHTTRLTKADDSITQREKGCWDPPEKHKYFFARFQSLTQITARDSLRQLADEAILEKPTLEKERQEGTPPHTTRLTKADDSITQREKGCWDPPEKHKYFFARFQSLTQITARDSLRQLADEAILEKPTLVHQDHYRLPSGILEKAKTAKLLMPARQAAVSTENLHGGSKLSRKKKKKRRGGVKRVTPFLGNATLRIISTGLHQEKERQEGTPPHTTRLTKADDSITQREKGCWDPPEKHKYFFARFQSLTQITARDSLRQLADEAILEKPTLVHSTKLRKYVATLNQVLDMKNHHNQWLSDNLGHSFQVHQDHYRLPSGILEKAKTAKLLMPARQAAVSARLRGN